MCVTVRQSVSQSVRLPLYISVTLPCFYTSKTSGHQATGAAAPVASPTFPSERPYYILLLYTYVVCPSVGLSVFGFSVCRHGQTDTFLFASNACCCADVLRSTFNTRESFENYENLKYWVFTPEKGAIQSLWRGYAQMLILVKILKNVEQLKP